MVIKHLSHKTIDCNKWDEAISEASNSLIYANSWYLDIISPNWDALISDDYQYVLPIPIKRKYKIPYIVQPPLAQQLGIFSSRPITPDIIRHFIQKLPSYSYELNLNYQNYLPGLRELPNYILNLSKSYKELVQNYSKNTIRNIEKAHNLKLTIIHDISLGSFIHFYQQTSKTYKSIDSDCLKKLIDAGQKHCSFKLSGVFDHTDEMIAALCYTEFNQRITYLVPVSNETGKQNFAMFYLVDDIIKQEAGEDKILDFEGSKIEGIARFYKGFGAKNQPYYILKKLRPSFLIGRI
ncbi:MAG: hypothetical protein Q7J05_00660 [Paludibacter sp.]|nr:hypothetical protein [Paludibacter sp.]